MRIVSAGTWANFAGKTAQQRAQALATLNAIEFLDADEVLIRVVGVLSWSAVAGPSGYSAVPSAFQDDLVGTGVPAFAVFKSGATEAFRVDCSTAEDATFRLVADIEEDVPIRVAAFAIGIRPPGPGVIAPAIVQSPSISGTASPGSVLIATPGSYTGSPAPTVSGQWYVDELAVPGAVGLSFTVREADEGLLIHYRETASSSAGQVVAKSNYLGPVGIQPLDLTLEDGTVIDIPQGGTHDFSQYAVGGTPPLSFTFSGAMPAGVTTNGSLMTVESTATLGQSDLLHLSVDDSYVPPVPADVPPENTIAPSITGVAAVGQTLTGNPGTWTGTPTPTLTYRWLRAGVPISGATSTTYVLSSLDEGSAISFEVTGTNIAGIETAVSPVIGPVIPEPEGPTNTAAPRIVGSANVADLLTATTGTWIGSPAPSYAFQWMRNGVAIAGETRQTYRLEPVDEGAQISVRVTATNSAGSTVVETSPVGPVQAAVELEDGFPQYLLEDNGIRGPSNTHWNQELEAHWPAYQEAYRNYKLGLGSQWFSGNWRNANNVSNSTADPYYTVSFSTNSLPSTIDLEVTALVERWKTENRGAYIQFTSTGRITVGGRLSETPPQLIITTPDGDVVVDDGYIACFAPTSTSGINTSVTAELGQAYRALLHWRDLEVPDDMISAKIRLRGAVSLTPNRTIRFNVFETDIPKLRAGRGGLTPTYGLALEVGEANLRGHPDVYQAGDMSQSNFFMYYSASEGLATAPSNPAPCATHAILPFERIEGFEYSFQTESDGTTSCRASFAHGDGRANSTQGFAARYHMTKPDFNDPMLPVDPATKIEEMYARVYQMLEEDFHTTTDGIKWGMGFDMRLGVWNLSGGYWDQTSGNSGTPGTGLKIPNSSGTRWNYQGHSIRQHLGSCRPSGTRYQKYRPLKTHCSNNGPFLDQTPFGTEENMVSPTTVLEKGKWHCVEWHVKLNSVTGPYDQYGNGVGVPDGILECWVDGVLSFRRDTLIWRRHPDFSVNSYWIESVHGGTTPPAPGEVPHYRFNNLVTAKRYIGPKALIE